MGGYLRILQRPGAARPFFASFMARLPISMIPLGIVLLVVAVRGSYAQGGAVTAAFTGGAAISTPIFGRLVDTFGQVRVIGPLAVLSPIFLATLALATVGGSPLALLLAIAAAVGLTFPPVGALTRGIWRMVLRNPDDLRLAYALDGVMVEVIYVVGPLLLSAFLLFGHPALPLLVTAALLATGGLSYVACPPVRAWRPQPPVVLSKRARAKAKTRRAQLEQARANRSLKTPAVLAALAIAVAVAVAFGHLDVSLAAAAEVVFGNSNRVGLLFACVAGGSAIGGTLYGARQWPGHESARLPWVLGAFAIGLAVVTVLLSRPSPAIVLLIPALFITGGAISPGLIMLSNLIDLEAPPGRLSEAQSWLTTAFTVGGSAGAAAGGQLVDAGGPPSALMVAALALGLAAALALAAQRTWRPMLGTAARPIDETMRC